MGITPIVGTETELKLTLSAKDLPRLLEHELLMVAGKRQKLWNVYYDTPNLSLMQQGMAVRERKIGRQTLLTVKVAAPSMGGLSQRLEWEAATVPGQFDFQTLIDDPVLAEQMTMLADQLKPIFTTDFVRRSWEVIFRGARIEIAIDQGRITSQRPDGQLDTEIISEVELELLDGSPVTLFALARILSRKVRLHPSDLSKAQRGYQLYLNQPSIPRQATILKVDPKADPLSTFKMICEKCLHHLQMNDGGILQDLDDEYIHQSRVAMRRIRTAIQLFAPILPITFVNQWQPIWRELAHALGDARNWDVFCVEQLPLLKAGLKGGLMGALTPHPDILVLEEFAKNQRSRAHQAAIDYFGSRQYSIKCISFAEALMRLTSHPVVKGRQKFISQGQSNVSLDSVQDTKVFANDILKRQHHRFLKRLAIPNPNLEQCHELRLSLKKLRYAVEFFVSLYPKKKLKPYTQALSRAQDRLGSMNDLATAEMLLGQRNLPEIDIAQAWIIGRQSGYVATIAEVIAGLHDLQGPWHKSA